MKKILFFVIALLIGFIDIMAQKVINDKNSLSDKMFAPNKLQIRSQQTKSTLNTVSTDLGDGVYLLDSSSDPSSVLVEIKADTERWENIISSSEGLQVISKIIYSKFNDDFDFVFFVLNTELDYDYINQLGFSAQNRSVRNEIQGLGMGLYNQLPAWGSAGKLKSTMFFPYKDAILMGPTLHEICHNWAAFICPTYNLNDLLSEGHWGVSNAGGQLGGFKYVRKVKENSGGVQGKTLYQASFSSSETNPDGSFKYPGFGEYANGGNGLPYSDIELYLMGMKSAQELRNANFHLDIYSGNSYDNNGENSFGNGYFYSTTITSYSIDDIIANNGPRVPDASTSQKQFKILTVVITQETATENYCEQIAQNVQWLAGSMDDHTQEGLYNFRQATNNIGSLIVDGVKNSVKLTPSATLNNIILSVGTLSPAFKLYTFNYTVKVNASVEKIDITGTSSNPKASISGNVKNFPLEPGNNEVKITVTDENGKSQTYTINVKRETNFPPVSFEYEIKNANQTAEFGMGVITGKICAINWGDGTQPDIITGVGANGTIFKHTYIVPGNYKVSISEDENIDCPLMYFRWNIFDENINDYTITSIDIRRASKIEAFGVGNTKIKNLDVRYNPNLQQLICTDSQLTSLDVSRNKSLNDIHCDGNQLTNLDLTQNTKLTVVTCNQNQLVNLDVSNNPFLWLLYCSNNQLTNLDISNNHELVNFSCSENQLTSLDISNNKLLKSILCGNNAISLKDIYTISQRNDISFKSLGWQILPIQNVPLNTPISIDTVFYGANTVFTEYHGAVENTDYTLAGGYITFLKRGDYLIYITNPSIGDDVKLIAQYKVIEPTKIEKISVSDIKLYPNPAKNDLFIKSDFPVERVEIYNPSGLRVLAEVNFAEKIDVSHLANGIYFVRIYGESTIVTQKIIVKK
jgi:hypothetical protein